jgi:hypothetical protein
MKNPFIWISEMIVPDFGGLRTAWKRVSGSFWPNRPLYDSTDINYELARQLYRNDGDNTKLGAGFAKPIIDTPVQFMGLPMAATDNETLDNRLTDAIQKVWAPHLIECFRNTMRDASSYVRMYQPMALTNPLGTQREREMCGIEVFARERIVTFERAPQDASFVSRCVIIHHIDMTDLPGDGGQPLDPPRGATPTTKEHEIWEVITPERYRFYDRTDRQWIAEWEVENAFGFVPVVEVTNEYDDSLGGGQSELESVYPFLKAFHEVLLQGLKAHRYHSTPKLKFKVANVVQFLKNNFPDTIDENGQPIKGATIKWADREVIFTGVDEDLGFLEAKSVLGDTRTLLEFLFMIICVVSETPASVFMWSSVLNSGAVNAETVPFEKRIERKRTLFAPLIQQLCKMQCVFNDETPVLPEILWDEIRVESLAARAQGVQQLVMSLEVLLTRHLMSDNTAMESLRPFFRRMKTPDAEKKDAASNYELPVAGAALNDPGTTPAPAPTPKSRVPAVSGRNGGGRNE